MTDLSTIITPDTSSWSETNLMAYRDFVDLVNRDQKAHVGWWAYQNGNSKIFTALCKAIKRYSYFHKVNKIIQDKKSVIAAELHDTETAILVGAADAVKTKELPILMELLDQKHVKLKNIILIDVSSAFNKSAAEIVKEAVYKKDPSIEIKTINKDILKLNKEDISSMQTGVMSMFMFGGLPFNSSGDVSQGLPRGKISEIFSVAAKIINYGSNPERNALIMDHKEATSDKKTIESEYPSVLHPDDINYDYVKDGKIGDIPLANANFEHFFLNCVTYMVNHIPGFAKCNPHLSNGNQVTPELLGRYFKHYRDFDTTSSNLVNGLEVKERITINVPNPQGTIERYTLGTDQGKFVLFNTVYPKESIIADYMGDLPTPLEITATHKGPQNGVTNVITISRPANPALNA